MFSNFVSRIQTVTGKFVTFKKKLFLGVYNISFQTELSCKIIRKYFRVEIRKSSGVQILVTN